MAVWPDGLIIFQYLAVYNNGNFAQEHKKFAKLDSKFCQSLNKAFKNSLRLDLTVQSGENLPTLVTLGGGCKVNQVRAHLSLHFVVQIMAFRHAASLKTFFDSFAVTQSSSVTRFGDLLDYGQLFKAFDNY